MRIQHLARAAATGLLAALSSALLILPAHARVSLDDLQAQINALEARTSQLEAMRNQQCPTGLFMRGIDAAGAIICANPPGPPVVYSASFTQSQPAPASAVDDWATFRASLTGAFASFTLKSNLAPGVSCNDPAAATAIAQAMNTGAQVVVACGAETFRTSTFCLAGGTGGMELTNASGLCNCDNSASVATLRPDIGNPNWGGVGGATCSAPSQTITLEFRR